VICTSSTEAEFVVCVRAGKSARYLWSILNQLGLKQQSVTLIYVNNLAAIMMANAGKPTERSRHIVVQYFALLQCMQWVKYGDVLLVHIAGIWNPSDALTKPLGWVVHRRHCYRVTGTHTHPDDLNKLHHSWSISALGSQFFSGGRCRCNSVIGSGVVQHRDSPASGVAGRQCAHRQATCGAQYISTHIRAGAA
jgi:hypothetical protein